MAKNPSEARRFTLDELCARVDLPKRTVRYYMQIELVEPAIGETRAAYYTERHLEQLLTVRKWTDAGLSLERVRDLLAGGSTVVPPPRPYTPGSVEVRSHLIVADGVELVIEPGRAGLTPEHVRKLFREVLAAYQDLSKEDT